MIQIGQKIDNLIDDRELEIYHNNEIKKVRLSSYQGKWIVLLFYPAEFTFICPTDSPRTRPTSSSGVGDRDAAPEAKPVPRPRFRLVANAKSR